jgi:hypothetical protein
VTLKEVLYIILIHRARVEWLIDAFIVYIAITAGMIVACQLYVITAPQRAQIDAPCKSKSLSVISAHETRKISATHELHRQCLLQRLRKVVDVAEI